MGFKNKQDRYKNMEHKFEDMKKEVIGFVTTAMADQEARLEKLLVGKKKELRDFVTTATADQDARLEKMLVRKFEHFEKEILGETKIPKWQLLFGYAAGILSIVGGGIAIKQEFTPDKRVEDNKQMLKQMGSYHLYLAEHCTPQYRFPIKTGVPCRRPDPEVLSLNERMEMMSLWRKGLL